MGIFKNFLSPASPMQEKTMGRNKKKSSMAPGKNLAILDF
jgi:hypothetical protein